MKRRIMKKLKENVFKKKESRVKEEKERKYF